MVKKYIFILYCVMKSLFKRFAFVLLASFVVSCTTEKKEEAKDLSAQQEEDFRNSLGSSDSLAVVQLGDSIMSLLKAGNQEAAFANLYELDEAGNISPLSDVRKKQLARQFKMFPVQDFSRRDLQFNTADQNIVTYDVVFDQSSNSKTSFALSPVKNQGSWYFTVRGSSTADGHNIKAEAAAEDAQ